MNLQHPSNTAANRNSANAGDRTVFGWDISIRTFKGCLVYLFLLGLIVRAGFLVEHAHAPSYGVPTLDQKYYDMAGRMIAAGQDLHELRGLRPLLYPMFLAVLYKVGGEHGVDLAVAAQHLLGVLTGLLVALLGARLFRHRLSGLAGGVLYLLAPVPLYFEGELLIESSYVFLICLGLLLLLHAAGMAGWKSGLLWLLCGGWIVLTAQERPNILVFMALFPLLAAWSWWRSRRPASLLPLLGLMGGVVMGIPWGFVNKMQSDHYQVIPSAGGVNFYLGNNRAADGMVVEVGRRVNYSDRYEDSVEIWARQEYEAAMRAQGRQPGTDPMAISHYWTRRTFGEIAAAPGAWLGLLAKKCWLMLWNAEVPNNKSFAFLQTEFTWLRLLPVRWVVLLMLVPAGIWAAIKSGDHDALFILLIFASLYAAADVAFFICDRYRYPLWPVMAAFAGGGLVAFLETLFRRRWHGALGLAAGMAVMASLSLHNWFGAKLPSFARDYLFRSIAWYEKGHFEQALADIDRSVALDGNDVTALHHRGNVLLALNRLDEARRDFERTLKGDPNDAGIWNNYGIALGGLGRTNESIQALVRATDCDPPSKSAFLGLAFAQIQSGHFDEAARLLDRLDKLEKGPNAVGLALRSVLARQRGDDAQAIELERQACELDLDAAQWAINRATSSAIPPKNPAGH